MTFLRNAASCDASAFGGGVVRVATGRVSNVQWRVDKLLKLGSVEIPRGIDSDALTLEICDGRL